MPAEPIAEASFDPGATGPTDDDEDDVEALDEEVATAAA